jgi:hypothetical protein
MRPATNGCARRAMPRRPAPRARRSRAPRRPPGQGRRAG